MQIVIARTKIDLVPLYRLFNLGIQNNKKYWKSSKRKLIIFFSGQLLAQKQGKT